MHYHVQSAVVVTEFIEKRGYGVAKVVSCVKGFA